MSFPIRCFTCGKVIAHLHETYTTRVEDGEDAYQVLDELSVGRPCCRRMFTTHVDITRFSDLYPTYPGRIQHVGPKRKTKADSDLDAEDSEPEEEGEDKMDEEEPEEELEEEPEEDLEEEPEESDTEVADSDTENAEYSDTEIPEDEAVDE